MSNLVSAIQDYLSEVQREMEELDATMEDLDMESKDFKELELSWNILSGQELACRYFLSVANGSIDSKEG